MYMVLNEPYAESSRIQTLVTNIARRVVFPAATLGASKDGLQRKCSTIKCNGMRGTSFSFKLHSTVQQNERQYCALDINSVKLTMFNVNNIIGHLAYRYTSCLYFRTFWQELMNPAYLRNTTHPNLMSSRTSPVICFSLPGIMHSHQWCQFQQMFVQCPSEFRCFYSSPSKSVRTTPLSKHFRKLIHMPSFNVTAFE